MFLYCLLLPNPINSKVHHLVLEQALWFRGINDQAFVEELAGYFPPIV